VISQFIERKGVQMASPQYFTVGVITQPHGLKGEVKVYPRTDFPNERFAKGSKLSLRQEGQTPFAEVTIQLSRPHQQMWIVSFEGKASINDIEGWKGMELCVHESDLMALPAGSYYLHQLIGLDVYTDDSRYVGKLVEVLSPGANDVYVIKGPLQAKDLLLPAIPSCILTTDVVNQRMTVHLMEGLLDAED
jgi:16S rRNA processing protein RimM